MDKRESNYDLFDNTQFGENLRRAVNRNSLTIKGAALALSVHRTTLSKVVNGKQLMHIPQLLNVCIVLNVSIYDLLGTYLYHGVIPDTESQRILSALNQLLFKEMVTLNKCLSLLNLMLRE